MCPPPGGAAVCHRLPARAAGRAELGVGSQRGGLCARATALHAFATADCFGCSFYVGIYYKWPCVRHTQLHTCTLGSPPGHSHQWPFRVCGGGGASDPGCEVCNDRLGRGGGRWSHGSQKRLTKVLGRLSHLGTPFQFLVLKTSLETVSCLPGWGDLRILQRFLGGDAVPPPECSSHLTSLLPFCTCSCRHYHPVWGEAGFTLPDVKTLERAEREGQAWPPGTEALASRPPLRPAHLETVLLASCPLGLHRYLIRPPPPSLPAPRCCSGGPQNLVPNDYVQIGDDGCCCCCFCCS